MAVCVGADAFEKMATLKACLCPGQNGAKGVESAVASLDRSIAATEWLQRGGFKGG